MVTERVFANLHHIRLMFQQCVRHAIMLALSNLTCLAKDAGFQSTLFLMTAGLCTVSPCFPQLYTLHFPVSYLIFVQFPFSFLIGDWVVKVDSLVLRHFKFQMVPTIYYILLSLYNALSISTFLWFFPPRLISFHTYCLLTLSKTFTRSTKHICLSECKYRILNTVLIWNYIEYLYRLFYPFTFLWYAHYLLCPWISTL